MPREVKVWCVCNIEAPKQAIYVLYVCGARVGVRVFYGTVMMINPS